MLKLKNNCAQDQTRSYQNTQMNTSYQQIPKKFRKMEREEIFPHLRKGFSSPPAINLLTENIMVQHQVPPIVQTTQEQQINSIMLRLAKLQHNAYSVQALEIKLKHLQTQICNLEEQIKLAWQQRQKTLEYSQAQKAAENDLTESQIQQKKATVDTKNLEIQFKAIEKKLKSLVVTARADIITQVSESHKILIEIMTGQISDKINSFKNNWTKDWLQNFRAKAYPAQKQKLVKVPEQNALQQTNYLVDSAGYLLDSQCQYLVDNRGNRIQLMQSHLEKLRNQGLMSYNFQVSRKGSKERDSRVSYKITTG